MLLLFSYTEVWMMGIRAIFPYEGTLGGGFRGGGLRMKGLPLYLPAFRARTKA